MPSKRDDGRPETDGASSQGTGVGGKADAALTAWVDSLPVSDHMAVKVVTINGVKTKVHDRSKHVLLVHGEDDYLAVEDSNGELWATGKSLDGVAYKTPARRVLP